MGFKEWWKKLSYVKKGAIIGAIIGLIRAIILLIFIRYRIHTSFYFFIAGLEFVLIFFLVLFICGWEGQGATFPQLCDKPHYIVTSIIVILIYIISTALIGMLIGFIIQKIKKKR